MVPSQLLWNRRRETAPSATVTLSAMPLKDHLNSILDVFSRRQSPRRRGYKPEEISERLRNRLLLLLREVFSGKWPTDRWS